MASASFRRRTWGQTLLVAGASMLFLASCDFGDAESLYDPDAEFAPDPVIESVSPQGSALAGVDVVTLNGSNFSSDPDQNLVYFNATRAQIVEAGPAAISVLPPNEPNPDVSIRVAVIGAENFSNSVGYSLLPAAESFGDIRAFEEPFALTSDADGNIYMSLFSSDVSAGIVKVTPDEERSLYVSTTFRWAAIDFAPDGALFGVRRVRALFRFPPGGGAQETWLALPDRNVQLAALYVDGNGMIWTGGDAPALYRIDQDKNIVETPFEADVRALKRFGDDLYVAAISTSDGAGIWRFAIDGANNLGAAEKIFDLAAFDPAAEPLALEVAASGEVFLGTDASLDPVVVVQPNGDWSVLYPGVLSPPALSFAWSLSPDLMMSRGRFDGTNADLLRINTRRERTP